MPTSCEKENQVASFYTGQSVFITGGTGFLGKVLIEKLLFSCPGIKTIYVLIRHKKGIQPQERFNQLTNSPVFQRIRARNNGDLKKIEIVCGDITSNDLGLDDDVLAILQKEVSIVFHLAASVNFNLPLIDAMHINVNGTQQIVNLCGKLNHVKAFVHVSTAYSNAEKQEIKEIVYPLPMSLGQARNIAELYSNDERLVNMFIGKKPNTYTFSKAYAEDLVKNQCINFPAAIVRPSIVMASINEPCPGWIDSWSGSTGLFVGMPSGVLKVVKGRGQNVTDLIPVDMVTNLIITAAAYCNRSKEIKVYNCCTGTSNPVTCDEASSIARRITLKYLLNELPFPFLIFTPNLVVYNFIRFTLQMFPAYLIDFCAILLGKKAIQIKLQTKISKTVEAVKFFLLNQWKFSDDNVRSLLEMLSPADKQTFNFDVTTIDWNISLKDYVLGARKYLLNK